MARTLINKSQLENLAIVNADIDNGAAGPTGPAQEITVNTQSGTSYTLLSSDSGKVIKCTNGSAISVEVPSGLAGTEEFACTVIQAGAGQITFTAGGGVTLHNRQSLTKSAGQYAAVSIIPLGSDVYILQGDMTS